MENIVVIQAGPYSAKINLSRGANCISLRHAEYCAELLREPDYTSELDNPFLYGMPILFPVNRISNAAFTFEDRNYRFPVNEESTGCHLHGTLHSLPFEPLTQSENFLHCVFSQPYLSFPHQFQIELLYQLSHGGLEQTTRITNLSHHNMPVLLGFHTTFPVCFHKQARKENIQILAEVGDEVERNMATYLPTGKLSAPDAITHAFQTGTFSPAENRISRHYRSAGSGKMVLWDTRNGLRLIYENDTDFSWRLLYNGLSHDYICMEPMTCMVNSPNSPFPFNDTGIPFIRPFEQKEYHSKIYLQEATL